MLTDSAKLAICILALETVVKDADSWETVWLLPGARPDSDYTELETASVHARRVALAQVQAADEAGADAR